MPRFNERTHSQTKSNRINELFKLIENSRDPLLQEVADDMRLRRTFSTGMDSQESESSQFEASEESQNAHYAARKIEMRNVGSNGRSTGPNLRELNSTPLSDLNAERSKTFSAFDKPAGQPSIDSSIVYNSFDHGVREGRRR